MKVLKKIITHLSYRFLLLFFTLAFSTVLVVGSTYSWFTASDTEVNHFTSGYLSVRIQELFKEQKDWQPGLSVKKDVRVENTSNIPAIVRVSFNEHMLSFEIDTKDRTGNGNLRKMPANTDAKIKEDQVATWIKGDAYDYGGSKLLAKELEKNAYVWNDPTKARDKTKLLKYMNLKFGVLKNWSEVSAMTPTDAAKGFWVYENGYFYYSQFVEPGKATEILLADLELSADSPNALKATLYDLGIDLEAVSTSEGSLDTWGLLSTSEVYKLLNPKIMSKTN